ncbi:nuclear transport factor 2 family protein [Novosphingobium chloroacetimidivorans]|nr:nuclear transport factor 2 family protein [Novosphingobium chloroacetimidivorans]
MTHPTTIPDFADWLAICNVKAAYCRLLDTKQWDAWAELFTPDCVSDTTDSGGTRVEGRAQMVEYVSASLADARTTHHVHQPQMTFDGPDAVDVVWAMQDRVIKDSFDLWGTGHYHERYVRTAEGWRIKSQVLTRLILEVRSGSAMNGAAEPGSTAPG